MTVADRQVLRGAFGPRAVPLGVVLVAPAVLYLAAFYLLPLLDIVRRSLVVDGELSAGNYIDFFTTPAYVTILLRTIGMAVGATVLCVLIAYPYAYLMTIVSKRTRAVLLGVVLVPFWTSMLARTYAWLVLLQDSGPIKSGLALIGVDVPLLRTPAGVLIGMVQILLPFMVLPLYNTLASIDRRLLAAARVLGAGPLSAFAKVYLPLSLPGVVSGGVIVYVLSLGFYVTPAVLGSPQTSLISQLIVQELSQRLAWGSAGAMSVILIVLTLVFLALASRWLNIRALFSREVIR